MRTKSFIPKVIEMGYSPTDVLQEFKKILKKEGIVEIEGIGTFFLKKMPERIRFNVGKSIHEKGLAHTKLSFKIANKLKKQIQPWQKKK